MDTLHAVWRGIRERKRDHRDVFREFLGHVERIGRRGTRRAALKPPRTARRRAK